MSQYFEPRGEPVEVQVPQPVSATAHHANPVRQFEHTDSKPPTAPVKVARDKAQYVRNQKGHSFILHWLVLGIFTCFIVPIYYSFSPNHYWHL